MTSTLLLVLAALTSTVVANPAYRPATCDTLAAEFPDQIAFPNTTPYITTEAAYWNTGSALGPRCIFYPTTAKDASKALKILVRDKTKFAIKSGGHSSNLGYNDIADGVTISQERLTQFKWKKGDSILEVGSGHLWGEVHAKAETKGRVIIGGRVPIVGVGGLTLGGGLALNSAKYGFAADNVAGFEVVLASGKVVYATQHSYADLYKALKGGGNNFGIVTRFDLYAYKFKPSWGANIVTVIGGDAVGGPTGEQVIEAIADYAVNGARNSDTGVVNSVAYVPALSPVPILVGNMYGEGKSVKPDVAPTAFKKLLSLPIGPPEFGLLRQGPSNLTTVINGLGEQAGGKGLERNTMRVSSLVATKESIAAVYNTFFAEFAKISSVPGLRAAIAPQPITKEFINANRKNGGNFMGLVNGGRGPYIWIDHSIAWSNAADDKLVLATLKKVTDAHEKWAKKNGLFNSFIFMNDADDTQDPFGSYGAANKRALKKIRTKYDPKGVFQKLLPGGFKLGF